MDTSIFGITVLVVPIGLAVLIILILGWQHEMNARRAELARRERIENARLPDDAAFIATGEATNESHSSLLGTFMVVGIGTYGLNQTERLLSSLEHNGSERTVGSVVIVEHDTQNRNQFHTRISPVFHDRIVYGFAEQYDGGHHVEDVDRVLDQIAGWGVPVVQAAQEAIDLHLRRNMNRTPSNIFFFTSLGGHAPVGLPILEILQERFKESLIVGFTALPDHDRQRERFETLKQAYEKLGVKGWILADNPDSDQVTNDYGMVAMLVGLTDAALYGHAPAQVNNVLALTFTKQPGAVLVFKVLTDKLPGDRFQPDPSVPPRYFVFKQPLVQRIVQLLQNVEAGAGKWSVDLPVSEKGTSIFDIVMTSVYHQYLPGIEDDVIAARKLRQKRYLNGSHHNGKGKKSSSIVDRYGTGNYGMPVGSIATHINPLKPECPVIVVRLAAVRNGARLVHEIVKLPAERTLRSSGRLALPAGKKSKPKRRAADTNGDV